MSRTAPASLREALRAGVRTLHRARLVKCRYLQQLRERGQGSTAFDALSPLLEDQRDFPVVP